MWHEAYIVCVNMLCQSLILDSVVHGVMKIIYRLKSDKFLANKT